MRQSKVIKTAKDRTLSDHGLGRDTYQETRCCGLLRAAADKDLPANRVSVG
jgi:hypothetical protein